MIFIGIDSGTQSTKAVALDSESGKILASAQESYDLIRGLPSGHMEQHPEDWITATKNVITQCVNLLGESSEKIKAIGISGQQHGLVVLDENDQVIRPAKLWCDTSTVEQCLQFSNEFEGSSGLIRISGNNMLPGYTVPKVLWLKQNEPENYNRVRSVLLPHDYINFWLTGVKRMEYGDASGTGLLNITERNWCEDFIRFVGPEMQDMLPELGSSLSVHGVVKSEVQKECGLPNDVVVSAGGGDNMMGAIGTGNVKAGVVTASFGTSGTLYGVSDSPAIDENGEVAAFCDSTDKWLPLVCTMNVTVVTEQARELFGLSLNDMESAVSKVNPGSGGLTFLPYLNGERTPNLPNGKGVIHGLTTDNMRPDYLIRSAMEGATMGLAYGMNRFNEMGVNPTEIRVTGGGSKSPVWRQISADIFNASVVPLVTSEGASLGAAIQAIHCLQESEENNYESLCEKFVKVDNASRCEPNAENVSIYEELIDRQARLTRDLNESDHI
ncbi:MAG: xylulokinase [Verrucomicrobiales bacterium]|nr:xylulokinase [Verrucomicrobiales bacterium]